MPKMDNKRWLAGLAMSVLSNPNADREAISNARETIYELIGLGGRNVRIPQFEVDAGGRTLTYRDVGQPKRKRKLSAWQKYIKNKRNHIKYRDGKLNLKKMGVEFRRKKRR